MSSEVNMMIAGSSRKKDRVAMLSHEEELRLIRLWQDERCFSSRDRVIEAHGFLVNSLAVRLRSQIRGPALSFGDLVAEGNIGLMIAIDRFDANYDNRFSTYAQWWATSRMREYIAKNSSTVRISRNRSARADNTGRDDEGLSFDSQRVNAAWHGAVVYSVDRSISNEDAEGETFLDRIVDESVTPERVMTRQLEGSHKEIVQRIIEEAALKPRELHVVISRFSGENGGLTFQETASSIGVTPERTRQIERKALEKLFRAAKRLSLKPEDIFGEVC